MFGKGGLKVHTVWNTYARIRKEVASSHIEHLCSLTPLISEEAAPKSSTKDTVVDLDTPDEIAVRALLLGLLHRTLGDYTRARSFFDEAVRIHAVRGKGEIGAEGAKWVGGVSLFEMAVGELKEAQDRDLTTQEWASVLKNAEDKLEKAIGVSGNSVDLSSRLDSRVNMLRGEITLKREMLGL